LPIRTFTVGFDEREFDEADYARKVATAVGSHHTQVYLSSDDALKTVPQLAAIYDEPIADPSQIPTLLVSRVARESVKVVLSGDGGDELFGGYVKYRVGQRLEDARRLLPAPVLRLAG